MDSTSHTPLSEIAEQFVDHSAVPSIGQHTSISSLSLRR